MRHYRRNADVDLRELERRAAAGAQREIDQVVRHKLRAGQAATLTLFEIRHASHGLIPPGLVAEYLEQITLAKNTGEFEVNAWISDPYPDDGVFETASRIPVRVTFGSWDNDQVAIEVPGHGEADMIFNAEYANAQVTGWAWGVDASYPDEAGPHTRLIHFRSPE
jgi:hypothetical protein